MKTVRVLLGIGMIAGAMTVGPSVDGAQGQPSAVSMSTSTDLNGFLTATLAFTAVDANKDTVITADELRAAVGGWVARADPAGAGSASADQLAGVLNEAMPMAALASAFNMGGRGGQPQTPAPATVEAMRAALPDRAPVQPQRPRRVLVLARAAGFVHSSIPLAAATIEALGTKTGAWTTTISYDAADITAGNLAQYDAVFLASTTGAFLDAPDNETVTDSRRRALLEFVRGGKGLAGIHAATDAYHADSAPPTGGGGGAAAMFGSFSAGATLAPVMIAQGDRNGDRRLGPAEATALADAWFQALDVNRTGRLLQHDFALFALMIPKTTGGPAPPQGPDTQTGTWPAFNRMIGGYFKYHWLDPQKVTVKIDDPDSPLTAMFEGRPFDVHDEVYTMSAQSWSRENVRVLTSIDYDQMSPADRALEDHPRADRDYGLSWIRREGQGRVFYEALGHSERIYANRLILEHLLAGMQYVLGDLPADDSPRR